MLSEIALIKSRHSRSGKNYRLRRTYIASAASGDPSTCISNVYCKIIQEERLAAHENFFCNIQEETPCGVRTKYTTLIYGTISSSINELSTTVKDIYTTIPGGIIKHFRTTIPYGLPTFIQINGLTLKDSTTNKTKPRLIQSAETTVSTRDVFQHRL